MLLTLLRPQGEATDCGNIRPGSSHSAVMATPGGAPIHDHLANRPLLSLESRLGLLRRRRRVGLLKQLLAVIGPVLVGMTLILLLAAGGVIASAR